MRRIRVNGITLAVRITGCGSPIVLVRGSLDDHWAWQRVEPYLSGEHRVVRYDRRGHGRSMCPLGQGTIGQDCADLAELVRTLELEAPLVVGHSYGGSTALLLGAYYPELTGGLVMHEILGATIPAASRYIIRGAGHAPHLSHPEEFAKLIRRCARQVTPRSDAP